MLFGGCWVCLGRVECSGRLVSPCAVTWQRRFPLAFKREAPSDHLKSEIPLQVGFGWVSLTSADAPSLDKLPQAPRIAIDFKFSLFFKMMYVVH